MDLVIEYGDGTKQVIATSKEQLKLWRTTAGPWLKNDIYLGTKFDQHRSNALKNGLPKTQWNTAILAGKSIMQNIGHTVPQLIPPIDLSRDWLDDESMSCLLALLFGIWGKTLPAQ